MQMKPGEIVRNYQEAKNKADQVQILAELNACEKEEIITILKEAGISPKELPRNRKKTEAGKEKEATEQVAAVEDKKEDKPAMPDIVQEALCKQMAIEQEAIDHHSRRLKELDAFLKQSR